MESSKKSIKKMETSSITIGHMFGVIRFMIAIIFAVAMVVGGSYLIFYSNRYIMLNSIIHQKNILSDVMDPCNDSETVSVCLGIVFTYKNKSYTQKLTITDSSVSTYTVGGSLPIYMNPRDPTDFMVASDSNKMTLRVYLGVGIVLTLIGILISILSIMKIYLIFHHAKFAESTAYYNVAR